MEMREFWGIGIWASVIGLGCNNFGIYQDAGQTIAVVRKALDVGINFLDVAGEHGSGQEESMTRLKTHCMDFYQVHVADPETPREETLRALDDLARPRQGTRARRGSDLRHRRRPLHPSNHCRR